MTENSGDNNKNNENKSYLGHLVLSLVITMLIGALAPFIISLIMYLVYNNSNNKEQANKCIAGMEGSAIGWIINIIILSLIIV